MKAPPLRFRQVHLDFHTSPDIPRVGARFDKKDWQKKLQDAAVDSITCFSKCHHGWSYHPTEVGKMHPQLETDLLRAQYDACREIDINVPIYLSAGVDDLAVYEHPEWREMNVEGNYSGWTRKPLLPGFKSVDFHSPYLDYLCAQIEEVVRLFPDCNGIFLDIIQQDPQGCSRWGMDYMRAHGLDPAKPEDRKKSAAAALDRYYQRTTASCKSGRADMPVFHNSSHIKRGDYHSMGFQTHLEIESLPTGGWGYDHFPESAKYAGNTGLSFLGMTGKFHHAWGEFGGFKHPNALRYECAAMIAYGSRCSVGDQLHPQAQLDASTYAIIGEAYREVARKEAWCVGSTQVADIGLLSNDSEHLLEDYRPGAETGASRVLLEEHFLFTIVDRKMDFSCFRLLILADDIRIDDGLETRIQAYLAGGGKLLLTGEGGLRQDGTGFAFDLGVEWSGPSEFSPDYVLPAPEFRPDFVSSPFVMYLPSQRIRATTGKSIGVIFDPYFNRTYRHFCSHLHAPSRPEASGYDSGVTQGAITYLAHPVFSIYRAYGAVALRQYVARVIRHALGTATLVSSTLPSTARVTLTRQEEEKRWVLHLLSANTLSRGGQVVSTGGVITACAPIEVIEELLPVRETQISLRLPAPIARVTLEPEGRPVPFAVKDGAVQLVVPEFTCHQMIALAEA